MARLFISYASQDALAASRLAATLESDGHGVWLDRRLAGGVEYSRAIEKALDECEKVIVLWSARAIESPWVRDEAVVARDAGKLVPVTIDQTKPPLGFRQFQTIDLSVWLTDKSSDLPDDFVKSLQGESVDASCEKERQRPERQKISFCRTRDGVTLAFSRAGGGPPLVKTANWLNHLEHEWENPLWSHWIEELSDGHTLLRYDERGNGMSDWDIPPLSFDLLVDDLETVVDAAGVEQFDLLAISQGCAVAVAFVVRRPERVRRLVLINGFSLGWRFLRDESQIESWEAISTLVKTGWGSNSATFRQIFTSHFFPNATREQAAWWNELQKQSASPGNAYRFMQLFGDFNVVSLLPRVRVPTLVMHCRDDQIIPFEAGRKMAARIPGSEFVALDSRNHLPLPTETAWRTLKGELRRFLATTQATAVR